MIETGLVQGLILAPVVLGLSDQLSNRQIISVRVLGRDKKRILMSTLLNHETVT